MVFQQTGLAREQTVGLLQYDEKASFTGYTLLAPLQTPDIYLIDNYGRVVHSWDMNVSPSSEVYLLPNGHLLRGAKTVSNFGTVGRTIQEIDWDGTVVWSFVYYTSAYLQHHDIEPMPNGNVLLLANELFTKAEAIQAGRDTLLMSRDIIRADYVVEIHPTGPESGEIVWEWHSWDHLIQDHDASGDNFGVVADHPELLDINYAPNTTADWLHTNAVAYNEALDQVVISSRHFSEFWVVDHSTTTAEAAGHSGGNSNMGGDIIYRWGNPLCYGAGTIDDRKLFGPHNVHWIASGLEGEGHILLFNNGWERPSSQYSSIEEIITPVGIDGAYPQPSPGAEYEPDSSILIFAADTPTDFYSPTISGCQRLPNGNTLVCCGRPGWFFEVTSDGTIVWQYQNPISIYGILDQGDPAGNGLDVFRCHRYAPDYPGLVGHDLTPKAPIEGYLATIAETSHNPEIPQYNDSVVISSRVWSDDDIASVEVIYDAGSGFISETMFDDGLHDDGAAEDSIFAVALPPFSGGTEVSYYIQVETKSAAVESDPPSAPNTAVYAYTVDYGYICGDINLSGAGPDIADLVYLVTYMFQAGPEPPALVTADIDGSGAGPDIADLVYLVTYMFQSGPEPACSW